MTTRIIHLHDIRQRKRDARSAASAPRPLVGIVKRLLFALREADRRHRERHDLSHMDDRILRDIGVTRADVEAEMRRPIDWRSLIRGG